ASSAAGGGVTCAGGGSRKNGKSGACGAAAAGHEKAIAPIAKAASAAVRREWRANALRLSICRPLFRPDRLVAGSASRCLFPTGQRFRDVCSMDAKRFRRVRELFRDGFATGICGRDQKELRNSL